MRGTALAGMPPGCAQKRSAVRGRAHYSNNNTARRRCGGACYAGCVFLAVQPQIDVGMHRNAAHKSSALFRRLRRAIFSAIWLRVGGGGEREREREREATSDVRIL